IFSTGPAARVPRPIGGAITAMSQSILWTTAHSTTQTSTTRRRPASTGAPASVTSGSPSAQRRKRARGILLSPLVAGAHRFLAPRYQSAAAITVQLSPTARTTRYQRPERTATWSRRLAWGARAGTSQSPTVKPQTCLSAWETILVPHLPRRQRLHLHLHLQQLRLLQLQLHQLPQPQLPPLLHQQQL